jgi:hypothetical protein
MLVFNLRETSFCGLLVWVPMERHGDFRVSRKEEYIVRPVKVKRLEETILRVVSRIDSKSNQSISPGPFLKRIAAVWERFVNLFFCVKFNHIVKDPRRYNRLSFKHIFFYLANYRL